MSQIDRRGALGLAGAVLALAPLKGNAQTSAPDQNDPGRAFEALWVRFNQGLAARDTSLLDLFAEDDPLLIGSAKDEEFRGKPAIAEHLRIIYALPFVLTFRWDRQIVHSLGPDAAWIWAEGPLILTDPAGKQTTRPYRLTNVLVRQKGEWKIQLFSGAEPVAE